MVLLAILAVGFAGGAFGQKMDQPARSSGDQTARAALVCPAFVADIYGVVSVERFGMRLPVSTRVELRTFAGDLVGVARSNPFGWYRFENVLPCQNYSVRAINKALVFAPSPILDYEFIGKGVRRDIGEIVPESLKR